jgi:hypothetical protein
VATVVADILAITDPVLPNGHRDLAEDKTPYPLLQVQADIYPSVKIRAGDGRGLSWRHTHQIDVYQHRDAEDDTLVPALVVVLEGATGTAGRRAFHVLSQQRTIDYDDDQTDLVHVVILLSVIEPR